MLNKDALSLCITSYYLISHKLCITPCIHLEPHLYLGPGFQSFSPIDKPRSNILVCETNFSDLILVRLMTPVVKASTSELGGTDSGSFCFGKLPLG